MARIKDRFLFVDNVFLRNNARYSMNHLNPDGIGFAALFAWSMLGLWIYLDLRHKEQVCGVVLLFIAGPAAWVMALWHVVHRFGIERRVARRRAIEIKRVAQSRLERN